MSRRYINSPVMDAEAFRQLFIGTREKDTLCEAIRKANKRRKTKRKPKDSHDKQ